MIMGGYSVWAACLGLLPCRQARLRVQLPKLQKLLHYEEARSPGKESTSYFPLSRTAVLSLLLYSWFPYARIPGKLNFRFNYLGQGA